MNTKNTNYSEYEFDDFVFDNSFVSYANNKNPEDILKWEKWLSDDPKNKETAIEAKILIQHFCFNDQNLSGDFIQNEWLKLRDRLNIKSVPLRCI